MKKMLRFITCGSVDDGKSTLIGHMLYDAKLIFADQKRALELDSKIRTGTDVDYSLLLDGLQAEREQGITIDVAYRYFSTEKRRFIVADTPGHEEYTRNMAVGASFAELAVILVDASKGVLTQTKRHTRICSMMGIRDFIFAVNKMDIIGYNREIYLEIFNQINELTSSFNIHSIQVIPVSATVGDNLTENSIRMPCRMPWYSGCSVLEALENAEPECASESGGFCMPVQRVCRPDATFRGFQGEIAAGSVSKGDTVTVYPSGQKSTISKIIAAGKYTDSACAGEPVTLCLDKEIDISRGCILAGGRTVYTQNRLKVSLLWMSDSPLHEDTGYILQLSTQKAIARITEIFCKTDIETGETMKSDSALRNDVVLCEIETGLPIVFTPFSSFRELGGLILVDRITHETVACGVVESAVSDSKNIFAYNASITREMREKKNGYKALTVWMTGLSGAGKSTLADNIEKRLFSLGITSVILDGDNVRLGLCKDLSFSKEGRRENLRRVAEAAKLLNDAGIITLAAFISPSEQDRKMVREIIGSFTEVYIDAGLEECIRRDTKGLYARAINGEIKGFTGIDSEYEVPLNPDLHIDTLHLNEEQCTDIIMNFLMEKIQL